MRKKKQYVVCKTSDIAMGERKVATIGGKEIGVFNIGGQYYALLNYCPHYGGALCRGPVTGTALPTSDFTYIYGRQGTVLRCAWHGWEFDIASGELLIDPRIKAKTYPVTVNDNGEIVVHI